MKHFTISIALASLTTVSIATPSAKAAVFTPFWYKTNVIATPDSTGNPNLLNDPTRDILLNSVTYNGRTYSNFEVVNDAKLLKNDTYTTTNGEVFGIMNSGRGPNTPSDPLVTQGASKPLENAADIIGSLGNLNLNSLIVTRESAPNTSLEVSFANAIDTIYIWERGGNAGSSIYGDSDILVEALDDSGNAIADYKILRENYTPGGCNISTRVDRPNPLDPPLLNNGPFNIGSIGLILQGASTRTLRLTSTDNNKGPIGGTPPYSGDNGPDFKLIGGQQPVPGPLPLVGLGAAYTSSRKIRRRIADSRKSKSLTLNSTSPTLCQGKGALLP
jgi:hypothetical protein